MHLALFAYVLGLTIIFAFGVRSPQLGASRAIIAVFILLWADLILTAHLLSLASAIDNFFAYVALSFVIALATAVNKGARAHGFCHLQLRLRGASPVCAKNEFANMRALTRMSGSGL